MRRPRISDTVTIFQKVAVGVGFEPTRRGCRLRAFEARAFNHSAIPPWLMKEAAFVAAGATLLSRGLLVKGFFREGRDYFFSLDDGEEVEEELVVLSVELLSSFFGAEEVLPSLELPLPLVPVPLSFDLFL